MRRAMIGLALAVGVLLTAGLLQQVASGEAGPSFGNLRLTVHVDETFCATGAIQCAAAQGYTHEAAAATNHNPVHLILQVMNGNVPVNSLPSSAFSADDKIVPAGGGAVVRLFGCPSCFGFEGHGVYDFLVHRGPKGNWKAGSYFVQVKVEPVSGTLLRALVEIDIPSTPGPLGVGGS
jgi:hypothetical protein